MIATLTNLSKMREGHPMENENPRTISFKTLPRIGDVWDVNVIKPRKTVMFTSRVKEVKEENNKLFIVKTLNSEYKVEIQ